MIYVEFTQIPSLLTGPSGVLRGGPPLDLETDRAKCTHAIASTLKL